MPRLDVFERVQGKPLEGLPCTRSTRWVGWVLVVVAACGGAVGWETGIFSEGEITVGGQILTVAIADTPEKSQRGLMEVEQLPERLDGMLFVYEEPKSASFYMLNTPMPLDVWWFDSKRVLIGSASMAPCPAEPCVRYGSPGQVQWVLETPVEKYEFDRGDILSTG